MDHHSHVMSKNLTGYNTILDDDNVSLEEKKN
jgi:hypothetical protein